MEVLKVSSEEYLEVIPHPYFAFGSVEFNRLNKTKCEELVFLLFKESRYRLGIIGGIIDGHFYSPFSAPFGGFSLVSGDVRLQYIDDAIRLLKVWIRDQGLYAATIILPPYIYDHKFIAKQINCLWRSGFKVSVIDLNFSFDLCHFDDMYPERIWYNAKKNLRIAFTSDLMFVKSTCREDDLLAYEIIRKNREGRGYPLKLSWDNVDDTSKIIAVDFFIVRNTQLAIASAIVFHISESVVQVVYWGDLGEYSNLKPMNFLSYKILDYYKNLGIKTVDIGPASEKSVPNYGLAEFKESIGCKIEPKFTLVYDADKCLY